jgi:hypothetical protein
MTPYSRKSRRHLKKYAGLTNSITGKSNALSRTQPPGCMRGVCLCYLK